MRRFLVGLILWENCLKILLFHNTKQTVHNQNETTTLQQNPTLLNFTIACFFVFLLYAMFFINAWTWFLFFLDIAQKKSMQQTHDWFPLYSHCFLIAPCLRSYSFFLSAINVSVMCLIPNFIFIFSTLCSVKSNLAELSSSFYCQSLILNDL